MAPLLSAREELLWTSVALLLAGTVPILVAIAATPVSESVV